MKQVVQGASGGGVMVIDVPVPSAPEGFVLVRTCASLLSAGTERMMVQFAEKNLAQKAMARPDLVAQVLDKVKRDGLLTTIDNIRNRLDEPMQLGYSAAGVVLAAGPGADRFKPGDRVACAGAGFANHAEAIAVPVNLCVPVPDNVPFEEAAFATVGAIALQGVRLAELQLGDNVAVIGLGLLGQIAVQLACAAGCRVLAIDVREDRVAQGRTLGAHSAVTTDAAEQAAIELSAGHGMDAVLIAADTKGNEPVDLAGRIARDRGTVVAVGAVGMDIPRRTYYGKELRFLISRSYGPGRYDPSYEMEGHDYPIGYVRWTEGRNLESVLDLVSRGSVRIAPIITHRFPVDRAGEAYDLITGKTKEPFLGVVLTYPGTAPMQARVQGAAPSAGAQAAVRIGVLGAGGFARATLLPAFAEVSGVEMIGIASRQGLTAKTSADRYHFRYATTDESQVVGDTDANAVVIATRHNLHARQVLAARAAGKHVFVEKPLCITPAELDEIDQAFRPAGSPLLLVGFNRRFAPLAESLATFFRDVHEPLVAHYRVNAGYIPADHWVHDPNEGGGRIVGEACHFVDFLGWLLGGRPRTVSAHAMPDGGRYRGDNMALTLTYPNGAVGIVEYVACGDKAIGKERVEVHGGSRSAVLTDFRTLELYRNGKRTTARSRLRQDKGHRRECQLFAEAVQRGGPSPIALDDLVATTRATFLALESAARGTTLEVQA